jgi:hypothetical protein
MKDQRTKQGFTADAPQLTQEAIERAVDEIADIIRPNALPLLRERLVRVHAVFSS